MAEDVRDGYGEDPGRLKKRILRNRRAMAKAQFDMITDIGRMRNSMNEDDLRSFLLVECGVPRSDVSAILSFDEILGNQAKLLRERATAFTVVKAMINADPVTRKAALDSIAAGDDVDVATISSLRRIALRSKIGERAYAERSRQRALKAAASAKTAHLVKALGESAARLLAQIDDLVRDFQPEQSYDPDDHVVESDRYTAAAVAIREDAKTVLKQFQGLYGEIEMPRGGLAAMKAGHRQQLAAAQESLKRFAWGRFGYGPSQNGFGFEPGFIYKSELQDALEYLMPCETQPEPEPPGLPTNRKPLRFVEICAGAGGQAIGLMQAGFEPVALYDMNANATNTLKKNWNWHVRRVRIEEVKDIELRQYHGIDLLAGGVECRAFSTAGKQKGDKDKRNLFDEAVRYVNIIRPRAFFFENVDGFTNDKFIKYRATVFRRLEKLGYKVGLHEMDAENFGLAQSRERIVLVGIRQDQEGVFSLPQGDGRKVTMADALTDLLFPHMGLGDAAYDTWAANWLSTFGQQTSYTVVSSLYQARAEIIERWKVELGLRIDPTKIGSEPIALGSISDTTELPYLTVAVAKALQGFPGAWEFEGGARQQLYQIGNAFPPQMSAAVGTAIARSLAGHLPNSVSPPPLAPFDETMIGVKPQPPRTLPFKLNAVSEQEVQDLAEHNGKTFEYMKAFVDNAKAPATKRKRAKAAVSKTDSHAVPVADPT